MVIRNNTQTLTHLNRKEIKKRREGKRKTKGNKESYEAPRFTSTVVSSRDHVKYLMFLWSVVRQSNV